MDLTAKEIMDRLVSFPSVSRDGTKEVVDWVAQYLASHDIEFFRMDTEDGRNSAIYAHVGPKIDGGILLSGHLDVVPVDGQDWTSSPWEVTERDGRYYGRGTCDMKGFDALALHTLVQAKNQTLSKPLQIALSYDEEIGCTGAPPMIERILQDMPKAACSIIGEPSMMQAVTGHKGGILFDITMHGYEVHSSIMYQGVSAIMEGAKLIEWANGVNAANMAATPHALAADFDPPYTNVHVGTISGGTAGNITAGECRFGLGFRTVPNESMEDWKSALLEQVALIEKGMKSVHPDAGITVVERARVPGLRPETDGEAERLVRRLTGDNGVHVVSYGTEAGQFQDAGYSSVICGPGDIAQAHQADEFISVAQFQEGGKFMKQLIETLCE
jgi:acetylornithine deacetylase